MLGLLQTNNVILQIIYRGRIPRYNGTLSLEQHLHKRKCILKYVNKTLKMTDNICNKILKLTYKYPLWGKSWKTALGGAIYMVCTQGTDKDRRKQKEIAKYLSTTESSIRNGYRELVKCIQKIR